MELIIIALTSSYVGLSAYIFSRFRRYFKLPVDERRSMTFTQRMLYLYGLDKVPSKDLQGTASSALATFQSAWQNMQDVFKQFETTFEQRKQELQAAEGNLTKLENEIREQHDRLNALSQFTPETAREVSEAITRSSKNSLRQQMIISAVFFVLGSVITLTITILVV